MRGDESGVSRRRFLRDAGVATATAAGLASTPARAATRVRRRRRRPTVAVFGGGVAGLTAAHELADRGFEVTVHERHVWGGKCWSTNVPGSATEGRLPLPGEHAFRVPFGFYRNLPEMMRRIPFGSNPNGVFDNMVPVARAGFGRVGGPDFVLPAQLSPHQASTPERVLTLVAGALVATGIAPDAAAHFADRMGVYLSSCDGRRLDELHRISWEHFIGTDHYAGDYRAIFGEMPRFTQASKASDTAAEYMGSFVESIVYGILGRGTNGPFIRVMDRPTNEAWIAPWTAELRRRGVHLRRGSELVRLGFRDGRITGAVVRTPHGRRRVVADHYVSAMPVERARALWTREMRAADPSLAAMDRLRLDWMNGITFFLRQRVDDVDPIYVCSSSPWAISFMAQAQLWRVDIARRYGDGAVHDKISAAIADWNAPGVLTGKRAADCTPEEVAADTWEQIKRHVNKPGQPPKLTDANVHSWQIDPGMFLRNGHLVSDDPLVLPTKGTRRFRPDVATKIPNLSLCGDYLKTDWIITTMESACETGRRAANAVLDATGSPEASVEILAPYRPPEWEPLKRLDEQRWRRGEPNLLDVADPSDAARALLRRGA